MRYADIVAEVVLTSLVRYSMHGESSVRDIASLVTMAELIDRLTIVNIKLFTLKNDVVRHKNDEAFLASLALEDVELCKERSKVKAAINAKLAHDIIAMVSEENDAPLVEQKRYGD